MGSILQNGNLHREHDDELTIFDIFSDTPIGHDETMCANQDLNSEFGMFGDDMDFDFFIMQLIETVSELVTLPLN